MAEENIAIKLKAIVQGLKDVAALVQETVKLVKTAEGLEQVTKTLNTVQKEVANTASAVSAAVKTASNDINNLNAAMKANVVVQQQATDTNKGFIASVVSVVYVAGALGQAFSGAVQVLNFFGVTGAQVLNFLSTAFSAIRNTISAVWSSLSAGASAAWAAVRSAASSGFASITAALGSFGATVSSIFGSLGSSITGFISSLTSALPALGGLGVGLGALTIAGGAVLGVIVAITAALAALAAAALAVAAAGTLGVAGLAFLTKGGFEYNAMLEQIQLGTGALIAQLSEIRNNGIELTGIDKLNAGIKLGQAALAKLKIDAIQTTATFEELAIAFQAAVGSGLSAGLNLEEIRGLTVALAQAGAALGVPFQQMKQEINSILRGTIDMNSVIAKSLGITNEMVKDWKQQGTLAEELTKRLESFTLAGVKAAQTLKGLGSNMREALNVFLGAATTQAFEVLKTRLAGILNGIFDFKNAGIDKAFQTIANLIDKILVDGINRFADFTEKIVGYVKDIAKFLDENQTIVNELVTLLDDITATVLGMITDFLELSSSTDLWQGILRVTRDILVFISGSLKLIRPILAALYDGTRQWQTALFSVDSSLGSIIGYIPGLQVLVDLLNTISRLGQATQRSPVAIVGSTVSDALQNSVDGLTTKPLPGAGAGGGGKKSKVNPEIKAYADAVLNFKKAQIASELDLLEDGLRREKEVLDGNFNRNLDSYEEYYTAQADIQNRSYQARIDAQEKLLAIELQALAGAKKGSERVKAETEILRIQTEIVKLKNAQVNVEQFISVEIEKQARSYSDMIADITDQLAALENKTADTITARIDRQFREQLEKAQAKLDDGDQTAQGDIDRINRLKALIEATERFKLLQDEVNVLVKDREQNEARLSQQVATGIITQAQANTAQKEFEDGQAVTINEKIAAMQAFADKVGDPKLQQAVKDIQIALAGWSIGQTSKEVDGFRNKISAAQAELDLANQRIDAQLVNGALNERTAYTERQAAINTYTDKVYVLLEALERIAKETDNIDLQAYVDKARADIGTLRADGDDLGKSLNQSFLGSFTSLFTSISDGTRTVTQAFADMGRSILAILTQVAIKIIITKLLLSAFGGGGSGGFGGILSGLFGGDSATGAGGSPGGFARGGYTGDGGINEVAGVVHGKEFVVNAAATARNLDLLQGINAGINPQRNLNAGSNVSPANTLAGAAAPGNMSIVNVLPNDLLANYVTSGDGRVALLNFIEDNAGGINTRLSTQG